MDLIFLNDSNKRSVTKVTDRFFVVLYRLLNGDMGKMHSKHSIYFIYITY